jgi:hypothetical protein
LNGLLVLGPVVLVNWLSLPSRRESLALGQFPAIYAPAGSDI